MATDLTTPIAVEAVSYVVDRVVINFATSTYDMLVVLYNAAGAQVSETTHVCTFIELDAITEFASIYDKMIAYLIADGVIN